MHIKYKKLNSGRIDRARSTYSPPGAPRLYHYTKSRKDTYLHAINPPLNSLDAGGALELSSPPMIGFYSYDHRRDSAKSGCPAEIISRGSSSRKFTTVLCSDSWTLTSFPLQPDHKMESNLFNFGEVITTRREYRRHEGGEV